MNNFSIPRTQTASAEIQLPLRLDAKGMDWIHPGGESNTHGRLFWFPFLGSPKDALFSTVAAFGEKTIHDGSD
ncbi:MAG: hypothetical protein AAGG44_11465 [Planctomycetota bacterium]